MLKVQNTDGKRKICIAHEKLNTFVELVQLLITQWIFVQTYEFIEIQLSYCQIGLKYFQWIIYSFHSICKNLDCSARRVHTVIYGTHSFII